ITQLLKYSVELYDRLEAETGQATGWKRSGGLRLACNAERMTEIKRQATTAPSFGLEMHLLSPKEARDIWPIMDISDLVGAAPPPAHAPPPSPRRYRPSARQRCAHCRCLHRRGLPCHRHQGGARPCCGCRNAGGANRQRDRR